jgi:hypothetical protein
MGGHVVFHEAVTEEDRSALGVVLRQIARMRPG